ncbi:MAG: M50 family metallopeptidase [Promethearchaeota archaeon]
MTLDAVILLCLVDALVCIPFFLIASLGLKAIAQRVNKNAAKLLEYLGFPGVVLHELCHSLMCRLFGIPVGEHRIEVNHLGVTGSVEAEPEQVHTFTAGFLVCFAPLYLLSLTLLLLLVWWPLLPIHWALKLYLAYSFFIGLRVSGDDVRFLADVARRMPQQALLEIGLILLPVALVIIYIMVAPLMGFGFSIWIFAISLVGGTILSSIIWSYKQPRQRDVLGSST